MKLSPRTSPLFTIVHIVLASLCAFFAWLQRNDIDETIYHNASSLDAALWSAFYLLITVLLIFAIFRTIPQWILILSIIACVVETFMTGPGLIENIVGEEEFTITQVSMSAEDPRVELSREFFGAVIALAGVLFLWFRNGKKATT
jgi:glucan phosphoethanolaminetransferase (alkaline phosphatase superfamily)